MIYVSWMTGWYMQFTDPFGDDIDAITIWRDPLEPEENGACCYGDDSTYCVVTDATTCLQAYGGVWMGLGTDCSDYDGSGIADICEPVGACCYGSDGTLCVVTTQYDCEQNLTGVWYGTGTDCSDLNSDGIADICEPVGACCYSDPILCVVTTQYDCEQNLLGRLVRRRHRLL